MCPPREDGAHLPAADTRKPYEAVMADAVLIGPRELIKRAEAHLDDIAAHLATTSGNAQYAVDMYNLERAYEHALRRAPRWQRWRLLRRQRQALDVLDKAHTRYKDAAGVAANTETGR